MADRIFRAMVVSTMIAATPLHAFVALPLPQVAVQLPIPVFDNRVARTSDLPTSALRNSRKRMLAGQTLSQSSLRALADNGDGLAAARFAGILIDTGKPELIEDAAHYFAIAAYSGRAFAVPALGRLLVSHGSTFSKGRLKNCLNAMTVQALSGNAVAATQLGQMYADGKPFGKDMVKAQEYLAVAAGEGNARAALNLGVALLSDPDDRAAGNVGARAALALAAGSEDLSARVTAENLLATLAPTPVPTTEVTP